MVCWPGRPSCRDCPCRLKPLAFWCTFLALSTSNLSFLSSQCFISLCLLSRTVLQTKLLEVKLGCTVLLRRHNPWTSVFSSANEDKGCAHRLNVMIKWAGVFNALPGLTSTRYCCFFGRAGLGCSPSTYWPLDVICDLVDLVSLLKKFWFLSKLQH